MAEPTPYRRPVTDRLFTTKELDTFVELYENPNIAEREIHAFLKQNPKFLFALGAYEALLSEVIFPIPTQTHPDASLRLDFMLKDYRGTWDVVELKKPTPVGKNLIVGSQTRRRFAAEILDAVAQAKTYLEKLQYPVVKEFFAQSGIHIQKPLLYLLIGCDKHLGIDDQRPLERDLPPGIQLRTYDCLLNLAKGRKLIFTMPSVVIPRIDESTEIPSGTFAYIDRGNGQVSPVGKPFFVAVDAGDPRWKENDRYNFLRKVLSEPLRKKGTTFYVDPDSNRTFGAVCKPQSKRIYCLEGTLMCLIPLIPPPGSDILIRLQIT